MSLDLLLWGKVYSWPTMRNGKPADPIQQPDGQPDDVVSSCCSIDPEANSHLCPQCGTVGPIVGWKPVQPHRKTVTQGDWQFCPTHDCPVVYYNRPIGSENPDSRSDTEVGDTKLGDTEVGDTGRQFALVTEAELRTQVANKGLDRPTPVCFCFSHTTEDLAADLAANHGTSTIKAAIKIAVAEGFCACEHLNPSGQCCLADIHRALVTLKTPAA